MAADGTEGRAALDAEIEDTQSTIAKLREAAQETPPDHGSRVALKTAEEKLAMLTKQLTRRSQISE